MYLKCISCIKVLHIMNQTASSVHHIECFISSRIVPVSSYVQSISDFDFS